MTRYSMLLSSSSMVLAVLLLSVAAISVEGFQQPQQQRRAVPVPVVATIGSSVPTFLSRQQKSVLSTTTLSATTAASDNDVEVEEKRVLDKEAIVKYVSAIAVQMVLFKGFFTGIDFALSTFNIQQTQIPFALNFVMFYVLALKSRIFNPMSNKRPTNRDTKEIEDKDEALSVPARKMPEWTPPGLVFPIVWLLIIGPLRAVSTALLVSSGNVAYGSTTILALMLHLSIGDTWNTINNVERRYGTSVVGVLCVWLSAAFAAYSYGLVDTVPLAGKLLSLPLIWLTIASSLIIRTWQINPNPISAKKESLLPTKPSSQDGTITKLVWFEKEE